MADLNAILGLPSIEISSTSLVNNTIVANALKDLGYNSASETNLASAYANYGESLVSNLKTQLGLSDGMKDTLRNILRGILEKVGTLGTSTGTTTTTPSEVQTNNSTPQPQEDYTPYFFMGGAAILFLGILFWAKSKMK